MRLLETAERSFCNQIAAFKQRHFYFGELLNDRLKHTRLVVDPANKKVVLFFPKDAPNPDDMRFEAISQLVTMVSILELLEKDGYILLFRVSSRTAEEYEFGRTDLLTEHSEPYPIIDDRTVQLLCKYSRKDIIPTDEFRRFCKRGFIPRDEQRFQRQIQFTVTALAVSMTLLMMNMVFTFWPKMTGESKKTFIKLDSVISDIHEIKAALEKPKSTDTTRVISP